MGGSGCIICPKAELPLPPNADPPLNAFAVDEVDDGECRARR